MTDKLLENLLESKTTDLSTQEDRILEPLLEEISLITDPNISSFVRAVLLRATDFWSVPATNGPLIAKITLQSKFQLPFYKKLKKTRKVIWANQ